MYILTKHMNTGVCMHVYIYVCVSMCMCGVRTQLLHPGVFWQSL